MKLRVATMVFCLPALVLIAMGWWSGYGIRMLPFGLLTPVVDLGLALVVLLSVVFAVAYLAFGRRPWWHRVAFLLCVLSCGVLAQARPWGLEGFEARIRRMDDAAWLALADDARRARRASAPGVPLADLRYRPLGDGAVRALAPGHPVLALGDVRPRVYVGQEVVEIHWGTGLIGTRAVEVHAGPGTQPSLSDGFYQRKRLTDHVTMVWE